MLTITFHNTHIVRTVNIVSININGFILCCAFCESRESGIFTVANSIHRRRRTIRRIMKKTLFFISTSHFLLPIYFARIDSYIYICIVSSKAYFWIQTKWNSCLVLMLYLLLKKKKKQNGAPAYNSKFHEHCFLPSLARIELLTLFIWMWFQTQNKQCWEIENMLCRCTREFD